MITIHMDMTLEKQDALSDFITKQQQEIEWILADVLACRSLAEIQQGSFMRKVGDSEYFYFEGQLLVTCTFNAEEFSWEIQQNFPTYH